MKFGMPPIIGTTAIDIAHTVHYATGYLFKQVLAARCNGNSYTILRGTYP